WAADSLCRAVARPSPAPARARTRRALRRGSPNRGSAKAAGPRPRYEFLFPIDQIWIERLPLPPALVRSELGDREMQVRGVLRRVAARADEADDITGGHRLTLTQAARVP